MIASAAAPTRERVPGTAQGAVLLLVSTLPIMGIVLIAPVLPRIVAAFAGDPHASVLAPIALTVPGLCIALFSPLAGNAADRFGRRRLLCAALVLYGCCGAAPLLLNSLPAIIVSRIGVGIAEAAIMTCSTTLLGDYFVASEREKWFAFQFGFASIAATVMLLGGGFLGSIGWRVPFAVYLVSFAVLGLVLAATWETRAAAKSAPATNARFVWQPLLGISAITLFAAIMFYIVPLQIGFVLGSLGVVSPATIGIVTAVTNVAVTLGALVFRRFAAAHVATLLALGLGCAGPGLIGVAHATSVPVLVAFAVLNQLGAGLITPALLTWAMRGLAFEQRGRGTGFWLSSFFVGQFLSPIVIIALGTALGLRGSIGAYGIACVAAAFACVVAGWLATRAPRAASAEAVAIEPVRASG